MPALSDHEQGPSENPSRHLLASCSDGLEWRRIEALFIALGAQTVEGSGSRVRFVLNDVVATFHRPHPAKEAKPYQVHDARTFLENAGVTP